MVILLMIIYSNINNKKIKKINKKKNKDPDGHEICFVDARTFVNCTNFRINVFISMISIYSCSLLLEISTNYF
jgi:hypothetical protein